MKDFITDVLLTWDTSDLLFWAVLDPVPRLPLSQSVHCVCTQSTKGSKIKIAYVEILELWF